MSVESACYLGCHLCRKGGVGVDEQRVQPIVVHRGLVIVCRTHGEIGSLTPADLAEKMAQAAEMDTRGRIMGGARHTVGRA